MEKDASALKAGEDIYIEGGGIVEVHEVVPEERGTLVRAKVAADIINDFLFEPGQKVRLAWGAPATLAQFRRALSIAVREVAKEDIVRDFADILGYVDNVEWAGLVYVVDAWREIQTELEGATVPETASGWWNGPIDIVQDAIEGCFKDWMRAHGSKRSPLAGLLGKARARAIADTQPTLAADVRNWIWKRSASWDETIRLAAGETPRETDGDCA